MKTLTLVLIIISASLVFIAFQSSPAFASCIVNTDWPDAPCMDLIVSGRYSQDQVDRWAQYYDYKGTQFMESKKIQMNKAISEDRLMEWIDESIQNSNVWQYYYFSGQASNPYPQNFGFDPINHNPAVNHSIITPRDMMPPIKQLHSAISPDEVVCKSGLVLVQKHNGLPACVTSETREKLIQRSWAVDFPIKYIIDDDYWGRTYLVHHTMCAHIGVFERIHNDIQGSSVWNMTDTDLEKIPIIKSMIEYNSRGLYSNSEYPVTSTVVSDEIQNQYQDNFDSIVGSKSEHGYTFWYEGKYYDASFMIC